jgi:hypothetical protein
VGRSCAATAFMGNAPPPPPAMSKKAASLKEAARKNHYVRVQELLNEGVPVDSRDMVSASRAECLSL